MAPRTSQIWSRTKEIFDDFRENTNVQKVTRHLPPWNFITIHYTYFIVTIMITSLIFWGTSDPRYSIGYTNSLFLVTSAMTEAGLNTVNLSKMTLFQQILLWLLIVVGGSIWVSIATVHARKRVFEERFKDILRRQSDVRKRRRSMSRDGDRRSFVGLGTANDEIATGDEKPDEPIDKHEFESRHSGPRDPTTGNVAESLDLLSEKTNADIETGAPSDGPSGSGSSQTAFPNQDKAIDPDDVVDEGVQIRGRQKTKDSDHIQYAPSPTRSGKSTSAYLHSRPNGLSQRHSSYKSKILDETDEQAHGEHLHHYPTYLTRDTIGRNAQFHNLTKEEREHLGGVEYRAICLLAWVVPVYFVLWQLLGSIGLGWYMHNNKKSVIAENGINAWWLGVFNAISAFNNSGMSLLDANMIPFQTSIYTLITMGLLILAGNTAFVLSIPPVTCLPLIIPLLTLHSYPLFLRLILWTMLRLLTAIYPSPTVHSEFKSTLRFVLKYPRRVYTNLFPSAPTWWLLFMLICLNGTDWAAFGLLNIGNKLITVIPTNYRILDGLFQALAVRSGGFYVVTITNLRIGLQVLYVIMMYISVYPVVITMRHSNVYEERSLGIYAETDSDSDEESAIGVGVGEKDLPQLGSLAGRFKKSIGNTLGNLSTPFSDSRMESVSRKELSTGKHFVRQQVRGQLAHDIWWLVLAILFISCIEVSNFERDPVTYSVFNITFEVVSAYGCVGISTGLPNEAYSFSGGWHRASKLILCAVMLRGRHRGLPVALDRAVRLPEGIERELEEEERRRLGRSRSVSVRRGLGRSRSSVVV